MRNGYPHRVGISIHALLAESDLSTILTTTYLLISIHALLAESDVVDCGGFGAKIKFLSTLSLRRATARIRRRGADHPISIHALLAESDAVDISARREASISIHALLAESDAIRICQIIPIIQFLSTLSLRRATWPPVRDIIQWEDFYPRSPCGERPLR